MNVRLSSLLLCGISCCSVVSAYDLHEWGTFTTVSGSDGKLLTGLHVEEESLPGFVYSHVGMRPQVHGQYGFYIPSQMTQARQNSNQVLVMEDDKKLLHPMLGMKGMPRASLQNVTVKMETPVIYFYGDDTPKVNVKVGFKGGTISQWYPQRKSGDTPNLLKKGEQKMSDRLKEMVGEREMVQWKPIDFSKPYDGAIEWDVEILSKAESDPAYTFKADENTTWIYPRVPDANMLKVGGEYEDYLFYRGVGNFDLPVTFSVDASETLVVKNDSEEAVPFAFAFENIGGKFRYKTLGEVAVRGEARVSEEGWVTPSAGKSQQVEVFQEMRAGLVAQGLSVDEANGMVKTWWKSYFNKPGLRVFWVVPQVDLERILPLSVNPKPASQVRVLVGRADVLRPKFEQQMIAALGTHAFSSYRHDRFILPYMNRLRELVKKPVYQKFDQKNIIGASLMIYGKKGSSQRGEGFSLTKNNDVKLKRLKLAGPWEIVGEGELKIGDTLFTLDADRGVLTAMAPVEPDYDFYEIHLPKVLN